MSTQPDLASPEFRANPWPWYAELRHRTPVHQITFTDGKPAWLILRYPDVAAALKDPRLAKNPYRTLSPEEQKKNLPWMPGFLKPLTMSMLDQDPPDHTRLRGLVHKAFTPGTVEQLRAGIERRCDQLLAGAKARGQMDLVSDFALPVPLFVITEMLGIPMEDRHRFRKWTDRMVSVSKPSEMFLALPAIWAFLRYVRGLVVGRRKALGDDIISALIRAEEGGDHLSEDELVAMVFLLLVAGHETTVNLISTGTLAMLDQPEAWERLRGDPSLAPSAVEELLRFTSVVEFGTERYTTVDYDVGGVVIPKGQRVFGVVGSANHDETAFEDPETLRLDRKPNHHLTFGGGAHYCLGAPLARMEAQIAFRALLREAPNLELAVPREDVRHKKGMALRALRALPVLLPRAERSRRAARVEEVRASP
ncbi:MAG TPA: cytochrome P450 [Myxococcaceae bacterium]|nr:cytochrome P450 [Myxococcaceae bacterium]